MSTLALRPYQQDMVTNVGQAFQGALLRRHILCGESLVSIAADHGLSKRTSIRHWREVREQLA